MVRSRLRSSLLPPDPGPRPADPSAGLAAVAVVLRDLARPEVLLIERSRREGDPWSGHMAFPGGREEPTDESPLETAIRETEEEIALSLRAHGELLGRLDDQPAYARGRRINLVIRPFVFAVGEVPAPRTSDEVERIVWADLAELRSEAALTTLEHTIEGKLLRLPGLRVGERIVWGLTYRMLSDLFSALG